MALRYVASEVHRRFHYLRPTPTLSPDINARLRDHPLARQSATEQAVQDIHRLARQSAAEQAVQDNLERMSYEVEKVCRNLPKSESHSASNANYAAHVSRQSVSIV
jgi:hypothetical protein